MLSHVTVSESDRDSAVGPSCLVTWHVRDVLARRGTTRSSNIRGRVSWSRRCKTKRQLCW
eukprot:4843976-Prymnesium_polylepis.1